MNNERKTNSNQRHSRRKCEKSKQSLRVDTASNSSQNDSSSSSENFQKELIEVFENCIDLRPNETDSPKVVQKLDTSTSEENHTSPKHNNTNSAIFNMVNENLNSSEVTHPEINGLSLNSIENKCIDSNKNDKQFSESNNNRQESKDSVQTNKAANAESLSLNAQLLYTNGLDVNNIQIEYKEYESEIQMQDIMKLIQAELSEPYSIYTYRYFIYNWPKLCFLATHGNKYVGAIVCKLDMHMNVVKRGYIAMLAVKKEYRKLKIGTNLVQKAIDAMLVDNADEVVLETEMKNVSALRLYENLGFVRDKRLFRYYLNGVDALRLKLWFN